MKRIMILALMAVLAAADPAAAEEQKSAAKSADFSFYGVRMGMSREEVREIFLTPTEQADQVLKPGHGMSFLTFDYDFRGRLTEIKASYSRPSDPMQEEALRRALKEKFLQPLLTKYKNIGFTLDEYSNRAVMIVVLVAVDLKEENINHFRDEYIKKLE